MKSSTKSRLSVAGFFTSFVLACGFGVLVLWVPAIERATAIAPTVPSAAQVMILRASHLVNQPWPWARQIGCTEFATDRPRGIIVDRHFGGVA
jgi:hypothetical protein